MSLSFGAWKAGLFSLVIAISGSVFAQPNFHSLNSEHAPAASRPGDQIHPALSLNPNGGFLVWDDNATDGNGQGIAAAALDSNFSPVQSAFRVNQGAAGDQEKPQVALLKDGGAVFVWQGGPRSGQRIYARFLSSSNTWAAGEFQISPIARNFQINPVVATLADGNIVVSWASYNQYSSTSMQDIYAARLSPAGQVLGSAFMANQFSSYNQRTPAIAALSDGRFVLVWVSEQQRMDNGVDIYARLFDANGSAVTDEFIVNTSISNVCANPSVAGITGGGFVVAWGERDQFVRDNGWDVYARTFTAAGSSQVQRLNTFLYGDQIAPRVASLASGGLAVWTSLGQDGSGEGVFGRFLDTNGAPSGNEFRVNTTTANHQINPAVASDGAARLVSVWSTFTGFRSGFDLASQLYATLDFVPAPAATNYYPPVADNTGNPGDPGNPGNPGDTNTPPSNPTTPTLEFPVITTGGGIVPNAFALAKGSYNGLFYETNGVATQSSGYFTARVTDDRGGFSASLTVGGRKYTFSGRFDEAGKFSGAVPKSSLSVALTLDLTGADQIRGTLHTAGWTSEILADRLVFNKVSKPAPQAGKYTLIIPGDASDPTSPGGDSFGTVKVDGSGIVSMAATLADGTKISQSSTVSKQGIWPLFVPLYSGNGAMISWLQFTNKPDSDVGGQLVWMKRAGASKYYSHGFTNEVEATGSFYSTPNPGTRALNMSEGSLVFSGGGMQQSLTNWVTLGMNNRVTATSGPKLTLSITPTTGLFKGSVIHPTSGKAVPFQGALFKKGNIGVGYFLGEDQSGEVYLSPAP